MVCIDFLLAAILFINPNIINDLDGIMIVYATIYVPLCCIIMPSSNKSNYSVKFREIDAIKAIANRGATN